MNYYNNVRGSKLFGTEVKKEIKEIKKADGIKEVKKEVKEKKINFDFNKRKKNTLHSLREVEHFLCNASTIFDSIKLYKILR